jgi:hypothetical protein
MEEEGKGSAESEFRAYKFEEDEAWLSIQRSILSESDRGPHTCPTLRQSHALQIWRFLERSTSRKCCSSGSANTKRKKLTRSMNRRHRIRDHGLLIDPFYEPPAQNSRPRTPSTSDDMALPSASARKKPAGRVFDVDTGVQIEEVDYGKGDDGVPMGVGGGDGVGASDVDGKFDNDDCDDDEDDDDDDNANNDLLGQMYSPRMANQYESFAGDMSDSDDEYAVPEIESMTLQRLQNRMINACKSGKLLLIEHLVRKFKMDVNFLSGHGASALSAAAEIGR